MESEWLKQKKLNIAKLRYITIKNCKNSFKPLKDLKQLELLREQEINEIKKETEIKLCALNDEISDELKTLEQELEHRTLKNRYFLKFLNI